MNRLYTVFLTVVLALVCSTGASAGAPLNLTLNCDRANALKKCSWSLLITSHIHASYSSPALCFLLAMALHLVLITLKT